MLEKSKNIIVYCVGSYGEEICVKLVALGYHVVCFCDGSLQNQKYIIMNRRVYSYKDCIRLFPDAIFVIANERYATALAIGENLEEDGYRKNETYFVATEMDAKHFFKCSSVDGLRLILEDVPLILIGETYLCDMFQEWGKTYLRHEKIFCSLEEEIAIYHKRYPEAFWIVLVRGEIDVDRKKGNDLLELLIQRYGILRFSRYFLTHYDYCMTNSENAKSSVSDNRIKVNKCIFLKQSMYSGSLLIDSIFDSHPNILYLGFQQLGIQIWQIVKKVKKMPGNLLADAIADEILERKKDESIIYGILDEREEIQSWITSYRKILHKYFGQDTYTERDILINIHLAYYELLYGEYSEKQEPVIYMDIHSNDELHDTILCWLESMGFEIILIEMIRKPYMRLCSRIKYTLGRDGFISPFEMLDCVELMSTELFSEEEKTKKIIRIRFEDLKQYPVQILRKLCEEIGLQWSDTLLETTLGGKESTYVANGQKTTGFDLKPVYYPYEEYFNSFDKFRLDMVFSEKNKAYQYSYIENQADIASICDIGALFDLPFKNERVIRFDDDMQRLNYRKELKRLCLQMIFIQKNKEHYSNMFCFGKYLEK